MRIRGNLEAVILGIGREVRISPGFGQRGLRLLVKDIAKPLVEEEREDELLVIARVNGPT